VITDGTHTVTVRSEVPLAVASKRALDSAQLREQLGRLGETPFVLGALQTDGLADGCFLPVSTLNHLRQDAVAQLLEQRQWDGVAKSAERDALIAEAVTAVPTTLVQGSETPFRLVASVWTVDDALAAADAGATEVVLDPFLRHPAPSLTRVRALRDELSHRGVMLRLRTPTIVRPDDRKRLTKWLELRMPLLTGHLGLLAEQSAVGVDVVGDYALNAFNPHTAAILFEQGAKRLTASVELTTEEIAQLVAPWGGAGFDVFVWGRPEGMTIEHCVLSAAFDREPTTCRDLCVQTHPRVTLTDPAGYAFPVATDSDCRNRLLHSRPIDGAEFVPALWAAGVRGYQLVFNVAGDPVAAVTAAYRRILEGQVEGELVGVVDARAIVGREFTRGHFERAV
jgi:putative protease